MKRFFFEWIWQWGGGGWIGFNPIGIEFEYDKFEPAMVFKVVVMGLGAQIIWLCPWETDESAFAKECMNDLTLFSIDPELIKEVPGESQEITNLPTTGEEGQIQT